MKNDIFGLTRKELFIIILLVTGSIFLIVFSSVKLVHKYYKNDKTNYTEIRNQSRYLIYLNNLNMYTLNIQRNALNMLVYKANSKEVKDCKSIILENRDSLLANLNKMNDNVIIVQYKRTEILQAGLDYLSINHAFLNMYGDSSINTTKLNAYNLEKMRPSIRTFTDLTRKDVNLIVGKIQYTNSNRTSLFKQVEFWLLLIGLMPYLFFLYKITSIIARLIFGEIFSK